MYAGFVERANAVEQLLHDRRTTFAVVTTLEGAPLREAEHVLRRAHRARVPPRRARAQQDAARVPARSPDGEHAADVCSTRRRRDRGASSRRRGDPALADPTRDGARAAHRRRVVPELRGRRAARGRAARRARRASPEVVVSVPDVRRRHRRRRRSRAHRRAPLRDAPVPPVRSRQRDHRVLRAGAHRDGALGDDRCVTSSGSWRRGSRSPTSASPTSCCSRRSRARTAPVRGARAGAADHRPDRLPEGPRRRGRRRGRAAARRARLAHRRDRRGRHAAARVERAGPRAVHPGAPRGPADRGGHARDRDSRSGADLGELERHYLDDVRPLRAHDRRGHVPVPPGRRSRSRTRRASATA